MAEHAEGKCLFEPTFAAPDAQYHPRVWVRLDKGARAYDFYLCSDGAHPRLFDYWKIDDSVR